MAMGKASNNCPACGSYKYWSYIGEAKEGISGGKAVAGGLLFGGVGMVAGAASGKRVHKYHCAKCGLSATYNEISDRTRNPSKYAHMVAMESQSESANEESKTSVTIAPVMVSEENINAILMRIEMFLEDGEWDKADAYCEQVLNYDPQCVQAYVGKLMAELKVKRESDLIRLDSFENNSNYQKAFRFAKGEEKEKLHNYIDEINIRKENEKKDSIYRSAKSDMNGTLNGYSKALASFSSIQGWKDSDVLAEKCEQHIQRIKEEQERERKKAEELEQEKAREKEENRKRLKKIAFIVAPVAAFCGVIVLIVVILQKGNQNTHSSYASGSAVESTSNSIETEAVKEDVSIKETKEPEKIEEPEKLTETETDSDSSEDQINTSASEETKDKSEFSLEDAPVGIKFYREITKDYIYKQHVDINEDGTVSISETLYSKDPKDKFEGGRITGRYYVTDEEATWNPDDNCYTIEQDRSSGAPGDKDAEQYTYYYKITFLSDDVIYLECYSSLDVEDERLQGLNGEYSIK